MLSIIKNWKGLVIILLLIEGKMELASAVSFNATVASDGTANYRTISEAVAAAPANSNFRYSIHIKAGAYHETVRVPKDKPNLTFFGEGAEKTLITANRSVAGDGVKTQDTATLTVIGKNFMLRHMTIENSAGVQGAQAVALRSDSNHSVFYKCAFLGYQDTLYAKSNTQFYRECDIHGTVDFVFGFAIAAFQNCNFYARLLNQTIVFTAQGKDKKMQASGFSIQNCTFTGSPGLELSRQTVKGFLGRPWRNYSTVVVMESSLDDIFDAQGWTEMPGVGVVNLTFREYHNRGPGSNTSGRVKWPGYRVLHNASEATPYTVAQFIDGDSWIPSTGVPYYGGFASSMS